MKREEINALAVSIQETGDPHQKEKLFKASLRYCTKVVSSLCQRYGSEFEDLYYPIWEAMEYALSDYDPSKGDFLAFMANPVQWRVINYYRDVKLQEFKERFIPMDGEKLDYFADSSCPEFIDEGLRKFKRFMYAFSDTLTPPELVVWRDRYLLPHPLSYQEIAEDLGGSRQYWHKVENGGRSNPSLVDRFIDYLKDEGVYYEFSLI